jgi:hypothetical protein
MMQHITGILTQLIFSSLEDIYFTRKPCRFIDAFVEVSLETLGFSVQLLSRGRLSFDTKIFLKIYLYGYLNGGALEN